MLRAPHSCVALVKVLVINYIVWFGILVVFSFTLFTTLCFERSEFSFFLRLVTASWSPSFLLWSMPNNLLMLSSSAKLWLPAPLPDNNGLHGISPDLLSCWSIIVFWRAISSCMEVSHRSSLWWNWVLLHDLGESWSSASNSSVLLQADTRVHLLDCIVHHFVQRKCLLFAAQMSYSPALFTPLVWAYFRNMGLWGIIFDS